MSYDTQREPDSFMESTTQKGHTMVDKPTRPTIKVEMRPLAKQIAWNMKWYGISRDEAKAMAIADGHR